MSEQSSQQAPDRDARFDVVVVGAGFAGLYLVYRLRQMGLTVREVRSLRWYYRRSDAPRADHAFFVTDAGDPAEMGDLDDQPRIDPPGAGAVYRIVAVPRDHRDDWVAYHAVPGTGLGVGVVRFVAP